MKKVEENMTIKKELDDLFDDYWKKIQKIANIEFEDTIKPFLIRREWMFLSGMGSYWIGDPNGDCEYPEDRPDDEEFLEIIKLLEIPIPRQPSNTLGTIMPSYRRRKR